MERCRAGRGRRSSRSPTLRRTTGLRDPGSAPAGCRVRAQAAHEEGQAHVHPIVDIRMRVVELFVDVRDVPARRAASTGSACRSGCGTGPPSRSRCRCPATTAATSRGARPCGSDRWRASFFQRDSISSPVSRSNGSAEAVRARSGRGRRSRPCTGSSPCVRRGRRVSSSSTALRGTRRCARRRVLRPSPANARRRRSRPAARFGFAYFDERVQRVRPVAAIDEVEVGVARMIGDRAPGRGDTSSRGPSRRSRPSSCRSSRDGRATPACGSSRRRTGRSPASGSRRKRRSRTSSRTGCRRAR